MESQLNSLLPSIASVLIHGASTSTGFGGEGVGGAHIHLVKTDVLSSPESRSIDFLVHVPVNTKSGTTAHRDLVFGEFGLLLQIKLADLRFNRGVQLTQIRCVLRRY